MLLDIARLVLFPSLVAFAAASDLLTMTISNRISILLAAGFLALAIASGMPFGHVLWHGVAGLLVLAAGFACYARGWIGGGDAKLAAATTLWLGFDHLYDYLLIGSLLGGALTLLILWFRQMPLAPVLARQPWLARLHQADIGIPYGLALATAALLTYPYTNWMATAP